LSGWIIADIDLLESCFITADRQSQCWVWGSAI